MRVSLLYIMCYNAIFDSLFFALREEVAVLRIVCVYFAYILYWATDRAQVNRSAK